MDLFSYELYLLRRNVAESMTAPEPPPATRAVSQQTLDAIANRQAVCDYIAENGPQTARDIYTHFGFVDATAHNYLNQLVDAGRLIKRNIRHQAKFCIPAVEEKRAA